MRHFRLWILPPCPPLLLGEWFCGVKKQIGDTFVAQMEQPPVRPKRSTVGQALPSRKISRGEKPIFHTQVKELGIRSLQQQSTHQSNNNSEQLPPTHKQSTGQQQHAPHILRTNPPINISLHPFWPFMHFRGKKHCIKCPSGWLAKPTRGEIMRGWEMNWMNWLLVGFYKTGPIIKLLAKQNKNSGNLLHRNATKKLVLKNPFKKMNHRR